MLLEPTLVNKNVKGYDSKCKIGGMGCVMLREIVLSFIETSVLSYSLWELHQVVSCELHWVGLKVARVVLS